MTDSQGIAANLRPFFAEKGVFPYYSTPWGDAYLGDSRELLAALPDESVALVLTSPPFALRRKKKYGNVEAEKYVEWFRPFAEQVWRALKDDGSFVIEIGGAWMPGHPTRSVYHYELLIDLVRNVEFHLAQEFFWFNPAKMPGPAQWVTIERIRCTDAVNTIWWLSKTERPKASNRRVLQPYSDSMKRLLKKGYNKGRRPSGHIVSDKWQKDHGGAIPKNLLAISNTASNDVYQRSCREAGIPLHPARFPGDLPKFFIEFLTDGPDDLVVDIFAGSNVTGAVAEEVERPWLAFEMHEDFLEGSKYRFGLPVDPETAGAKEQSP
jgi:DNA modification methylase